MTFPVVELSPLPPNTVVPIDESLFVPYLNRLYEDVAFSVNERDNSAFAIEITDTPAAITNVPNYGAFIVCVAAAPVLPPLVNGTLPTLTASLCKSSIGVAGQVVVLGSQVGSGAWAGINLTITSSATNFLIAHNNAGISGDFNIRICGTQ